MSVHADNHPSWKELAKPVVAWLREAPRTWPEIDRFAAENQIPQTTMTNILAWLENRNLARGYSEDGVMVWQLRSGGRRPARQKLPDVPVHEEPKEHREDEHRDAGEKRPSDEEQNGNPKRRQKRERRQNPRKPKPERLHGSL